MNHGLLFLFLWWSSITIWLLQGSRSVGRKMTFKRKSGFIPVVVVSHTFSHTLRSTFTINETRTVETDWQCLMSKKGM